MRIEGFCSEPIKDFYCPGVCTDWEKPRELMIGCVREEVSTRHPHNKSYGLFFFLLCSASSLLSSVFVPPNKPMFVFLCSANHTSCSVRHAGLWLMLSNNTSRRVQFVSLVDCTVSFHLYHFLSCILNFCAVFLVSHTFRLCSFSFLRDQF
jgi:hypothetical protein